MASETGISSRPPFPVLEAWPPDDTEESIVGTSLHQTTIVNTRWGINEAAQMARVSEQPAPWEALDQIVLLGFRRADGSRYKTMPDVFVYRQRIEPMSGSLSLEEEGPPLLVIEVLSEATYRADLDMERGKGYSYARAGVREYLTIDPSGQFLAEGIRAWRLMDGVYRPWQADGAGRWQSEEIDVAFALEGVMATVYTLQGQRILREGEVHLELAQREREVQRERQARQESVRREDEARRELARRDAEIARQAEELAQRDVELVRLRLILEERQSGQ